MAAAAHPRVPDRYGPWAALLVVALGYFMNIIDSGASNVAAPSIASDLHASVGQLLWVLNGYLFTFAMLLLLGGRLGDLVGHRNMFFVGLLLFTAASLGCALSASVAALIAARVAQGVGAAAMAPQALAVTTAVFPPERRAMAFGVLATVLGSAAAAAPVLGGVLTDAFGWRSIFYLNLPIGAVGMAATYLVLPATRRPGRQQVPVTVSLLASIGMFAVLYALIEGAQLDWGAILGPVRAAQLLVAGVVVVAGVVCWEWTRTDGLLPRALFTVPNYRLMIGASAATYFGIFGTQLVMTFYLQSALGAGPLAAGLVLSPMWLTASLVAPVSGRLATRFSLKDLLVVGYLGFGVGVAVTALLTPHQLPSGWFVPSLIVAGAGAGMTFAPLTTVAMQEVSPEAFGGASGLIEVVRQLGGAVCIATLGAIMQAVWTGSLRGWAAHGTAPLSPADRASARMGVDRLIHHGLHPGSGDLASETSGSIGQLLTKAAMHGLVVAAEPALLISAVVILSASVAAVLIQPRSSTRNVEAAAAPGGGHLASSGSALRRVGYVLHRLSRTGRQVPQK
ncbi:MAG TPA: DHA2 family efflux MFS transporter permease subunit [Jatrophihabitans sp.]|nr:DHA2 family efflux MFS transporter permease subunit [Jatrophihabitans sp.]